MNIVDFAEEFCGLKLNAWQKQLLTVYAENPKLPAPSVVMKARQSWGRALRGQQHGIIIDDPFCVGHKGDAEAFSAILKNRPPHECGTTLPAPPRPFFQKDKTK